MKKIFVLMACLGLAALPLSGCSSKGDGAQASGVVTEKDLQHHRFVLASAGGKTFQLEAERQPSIEFNEKMNVSGRICNQYRGQGELKDGYLFVRQMISTKMLCIDPELNKLESDFSQMLTNGASIRLEKNILTLSKDDYEIIFRLSDYMN